MKTDNAFFDAINKAGGIGGRKLIPVYQKYKPIGSQDPMIVFDSSLLERLAAGEQRVVLAHELGHILSDHVLYMTALDILLRAGINLPRVMGLPLRAVRAVLLEWRRAAELSCDRAATLAVRDPRIVCRTLMVTAAGLPSSSRIGRRESRSIRSK